MGRSYFYSIRVDERSKCGITAQWLLQGTTACTYHHPLEHSSTRRVPGKFATNLLPNSACCFTSLQLNPLFLSLLPYAQLLLPDSGRAGAPGLFSFPWSVSLHISGFTAQLFVFHSSSAQASCWQKQPASRPRM